MLFLTKEKWEGWGKKLTMQGVYGQTYDLTSLKKTSSYLECNGQYTDSYETLNILFYFERNCILCLTHSR